MGEKAVRAALACGFRHFDCAKVYGNEKLVGDALREALDSGVAKDYRDMFEMLDTNQSGKISKSEFSGGTYHAL